MIFNNKMRGSFRVLLLRGKTGWIKEFFYFLFLWVWALPGSAQDLFLTVLRNNSWQNSGDHLECRELNQSWLCNTRSLFPFSVLTFQLPEQKNFWNLNHRPLSFPNSQGLLFQVCAPAWLFPVSSNTHIIIFYYLKYILNNIIFI